jgi:DUF917 family protein
MSTYRLSPDDVAPLLEGLAILGTGGGGSPSWGKAILEHEFSVGRTPSIVPLQEIEDDATVVSGGMMGSIKVLEDMGIAAVMEHWDNRFELLEVTRVMEGILGKGIDHVVPFEVGGLNTPVMLSLGARMGISVIDGDALGRSAPETQMTSFIGHGVSLTPMPLIDYEGNVVIVQEAPNPTYPDQLGRWVVTHGGGMGANNHYPMSGRQAKGAIVPNTISFALRLGRTVLGARQQGSDPVLAATETLGGVLLFTGSVVRLEEAEKMGFFYTVVDLQGTGPHERLTARLVIKNETMLLSIDGSVRAIFPDLVCMLEQGTGRGVMSTELTEGVSVSLVGTRCHERLREALRSEVGALAFSPSRYGYPELEYQPIEDLVEGFR